MIPARFEYHITISVWDKAFFLNIHTWHKNYCSDPFWSVKYTPTRKFKMAETILKLQQTLNMFAWVPICPPDPQGWGGLATRLMLTFLELLLQPRVCLWQGQHLLHINSRTFSIVSMSSGRKQVDHLFGRLKM